MPFSTHVVRAPQDNDSIGVVLVKLAEQLNAAALVLAKHDKGRLSEFLLGSVTRYVTHHCRQPVLVMHADRAGVG